MRFMKQLSLLIVLSLLAGLIFPRISSGAEAPLLEIVRRSGGEDVLEVLAERVVENDDGSVTADISIKAIKRIAYNITFANNGTSFDALEEIEFLPLYPHNTYFVGQITFHPGDSLIIKQDKWGSGSAVDVTKMTVVNASVAYLEFLGIEPLGEFDVFDFALSIGEVMSIIPFGDATLIATYKLSTDIDEGADALTIIEDILNLIEEIPGIAEAIVAALAALGISASAATVAAGFSIVLIAGFGTPRLLNAIGDWILGPDHVETEIRVRETGHAVDVFMLVDLSGSFYDDLPVFKAQAPGIITNLKTSNPNTQFGLGKFEDYPIDPFGDSASGDQAYERLVDLTLDSDQVITTISGLSTRFGSDDPESQLPALYQAATGAGQDLSSLGYANANIPPGQQASFRDGASKLFLLWTDASFHQAGDTGSIPYPGPTFAETVSAIMALDPPKVIGISSGEGGLSDLKAIASATDAFAPDGGVDCNSDGVIDIVGGQPFVCSIASSGSGIGEAVMAAVEATIWSPVAVAGGPYIGRIGESITFDGSASFDPNGTVETYQWDFDNDGMFDFTSSFPTASHIYSAEYSGNVTLRITDNDGLTGSTYTSVDVMTVTDLALEMTLESDQAILGQDVKYRLIVTNHGPDDATKVFVSDALLSEDQIESVVPSQGNCVINQGAGLCDLGVIKSGSSATITIVASIETLDPIRNSAFVEVSDSLDLNPENNGVIKETPTKVPIYLPSVFKALFNQ